DIDLTVLEVNTERPAPAVLHGHPDTEVGEPFGGVVASARRLARLKSVDADPQTGMLLVLLPVPDHVRLVHSAPLDILWLLPICGLGALSNGRNGPWAGGFAAADR